MENVIAYDCNVLSLALMQEEYGPDYIRLVNRWDLGTAGTEQRFPYWGQNFSDFIKYLQANKGKSEVFAILKHVEENGIRTYRYIGHMGIHGIKWPDGHGTTGSIIVDPEGRGKGYGSHAKHHVLHHAFGPLGLRKICSSVKAFNGNSLGSLLKCGYEIVGRRKQHIAHEGGYVDEILLEVFPHTWRPLWERYKATGEIPSLTDEQRALVKKETNT